MAESIGKSELPGEIEQDGDAGDSARAALGERLVRHAATEFDIPGITRRFLAGSPIVVRGRRGPARDWHRYTHGGTPERGRRRVARRRRIDLRPLQPRLHAPAFQGGHRHAPSRRGGTAPRRAASVLDLSSEEARDVYARTRR